MATNKKYTHCQLTLDLLGRFSTGSAIVACWVLSIMLYPGSALALSPGDCNGANGNAQCLIQVYINPVIALLSALVGVLVVMGVIWGAILFIQAGDDPSKAAAGRKKITNSLLGLVAFLLLYVFLQFILPGGAF